MEVFLFHVAHELLKQMIIIYRKKTKALKINGRGFVRTQILTVTLGELIL